MTDKEIIKGLKCCLGGKEELCKECPFNGECYGDVEYLIAYALGLINRQQEQLEAAIAGQETLQKALAEKDREVERLTAEKEQLIKTFGECQAEATKALVDKDKEIERLKNNISAMAVTMRNCAKETRAEAIRAFVKRLKRECLIDRGYEILHEGTIDNLVKEMVGGTE